MCSHYAPAYVHAPYIRRPASLRLTPQSLPLLSPQDRDRRSSSQSAGTSAPTPPAAKPSVIGSGLALGPIGLSFGSEFGESDRGADEDGDGAASSAPGQSIHSMTTAEWRAKYEKDGTIDLWAEEEFNAGSRLVVNFWGGCWTWGFVWAGFQQVSPFV